ncbi:MAG: histidine phosphotransferase [Candidatus Liberibacter ctenarytainae]|uniref:Histidine phosphotransferase n=1 Tax=Candidatus Liberibacter ctenarytainae TaxID=2020335 RepID=A0A937DJE7_9HYPH|nr:histidine phosphotransferase [Candidatus Liberibacter ctenarytainae]
MVKNPCFNLSATDLSALLCSRLCHDIISPVGAIHIGVELLDEEGMEDEAIQLIRLSTKNAITRLNFLRVSYSYVGSNDSFLNFGKIKDIVENFVSIDDRVKVSWIGEKSTISKKKVKILLNLFIIACSSLPRGGDIKILINDSILNKSKDLFSFQINGVLVRLPEKFIQIISGEWDFQVDSYEVHLYYTALLAQEDHITLSYQKIDDQNMILSASTDHIG